MRLNFNLIYWISLTIITFCFNQIRAEDKKPKIEVVFVLDTTGSMSGLIEAAKNKIWSIATTMAQANPSPEVKMGLVGYRDRGDDYITTISALSIDLDKVYKDLMQYSAYGGGDSPESVNQALHEAVNKLQWDESPNTYKVIFLVGDESPHMDYQDDIKYQESCALANKKGIIINTIQCGNSPTTVKYWIEIANKGKGTYFQISQNGGSIVYESPYDKEINKISEELDNSRIYYGNSEDIKNGQKRQEWSKEINNKASVSSLASRACYNNSKTGEANAFSNKELINDIEKSIVKLEDLSDDQLPEEIKKIKKENRKATIESNIKKRKDLKDKLDKLTNSRQIFIQELASKKTDEKDSFDSKVFECVQSQAKLKDITIKNKKH
jgi:Mg-chelatase subunit ChlD